MQHTIRRTNLIAPCTYIRNAHACMRACAKRRRRQLNLYPPIIFPFFHLIDSVPVNIRKFTPPLAGWCSSQTINVKGSTTTHKNRHHTVHTYSHTHIHTHTQLDDTHALSAGVLNVRFQPPSLHASIHTSLADRLPSGLLCRSYSVMHYTRYAKCPLYS